MAAASRLARLNRRAPSTWRHVPVSSRPQRLARRLEPPIQLVDVDVGEPRQHRFPPPLALRHHVQPHVLEGGAGKVV